MVCAAHHQLAPSAPLHARCCGEVADIAAMRPLSNLIKCLLVVVALARVAGVSTVACAVAVAVLLAEHFTPSLYILDRRLRDAAAPGAHQRRR
jgi:hypothetical protein